MVEAYEKLIFENELIFIEELLPVKQKLIAIKETNQKNDAQLEKRKLLKKWKKSEGNYYLNTKNLAKTYTNFLGVGFIA